MRGKAQKRRLNKTGTQYEHHFDEKSGGIGRKMLPMKRRSTTGQKAEAGHRVS